MGRSQRRGVHEWFVSIGSLPLRVLVTLAGVAALLVGWLGVRALRRRFDGGLLARGLTLLLVAGYLALVLGTAAAVVATWNLEGEASGLLASQTGRVALLRAVVTVSALTGAYLLVGASRRVVDEFVEASTALSNHEGEALFRGIQVALYGLAVLGILGVWNLNLTNLLISAGVLGVVLGLAAQQTLGSAISGFVIMISRPFEIGDYVEVGGREGLVTDVTVFSTRLRTVDREHVSIPNDVVESGEIVNFSRDDRLRVDVALTVDYDADLETAVDTALAAAADVDGVLEQPRPDYDVRFGDSGMELEVRVVIENPTARRRWHVRRDVVVAVKGAFDEAGLEIPVPRRELATRGDDGEFHVRSETVEE